MVYDTNPEFRQMKNSKELEFENLYKAHKDKTFSAKEKKKPEQADLPSGMDLAEPENNSHEQELQLQKLYNAINALPETDRVIATLLLENTPYKTIAAVTGISENYVAVKINRIKISLTQLLNPYGK